MAREKKAEPRQRFSMLQSLLGGKKNKRQSTLGEPVLERRVDEPLPFQPSVVRSHTMPMITTDPLASHPVRLESMHGSITDGTSSSASSISGLSILGDMAVATSAPATPVGGEQQAWSGRPTQPNAGAVTGLQALFADPNDIAIFSSPVTASPATTAASSPITPGPVSPASPAPAASSPSSADTDNHKFRSNIVRRTRASRPASRVFSPQQPSPLSAAEEPSQQRSVSAPVAVSEAAPAQLPPRPSSSSGATTATTATATSATTDPLKGLMLQIPKVPQKNVKRVWNPTGGRFRSVSEAPPSPIAEEAVELPPRPVTAWGSKAWEGAVAQAVPRSAVEAPSSAWCNNLTTKDIGSLTPELRSGGKMLSEESPICLPDIDRGPNLSAIFTGEPPVLPASAPAAKPPTRRHTSPTEVYELEGSSTDEDIYDDEDYDDDSSLRHSAVSEASSAPPPDACPPLDRGVCSPATNHPSPATPLGSFGNLTYAVASPVVDNKQYKAFRPGLVRSATDLDAAVPQATPRPRESGKAACDAWVRRSQLFQMNEKTVPMRRHIPEC